jgi:hypothetical protein
MASIIKADNIQKVSDGSNIIKKCGSTITLGSCGATISLAAGATQTGFGQSYSASLNIAQQLKQVLLLQLQEQVILLIQLVEL